MKTTEEIYYPASLLRGKTARAEYSDPIVGIYRGNPLIEALGPILPREELERKISNNPPYSSEERNLPPEIRKHSTDTVTQLFQPLSQNIRLAEIISMMLRTGYVGRNPIDHGFWPGLKKQVGFFESGKENTVRYHSNVCGLAVPGMSGTGKTTAMNSTLELLPQVILHNKYHGNPFSYTQVVWLKLDCPGDVSLRGLILSFFMAMGDLLNSNYYKLYTGSGRATLDSLIPLMANLAGVHGLGLLIVDEAQNLAEAHYRGEKRMLNYFVELENYIGVPVVLLGTDKLIPVLGRNEFRQARRMTAEGDLRWKRLKNDKDWELIVRSLLGYQYTKNSCEFSQEFSTVLYDVSQGIIDIAVKVYKLAQLRAIQTGYERLDAGVVRSVAGDSFESLKKALSAIRNHTEPELRQFEDFYTEWKTGFDEQMENQARIYKSESNEINIGSNNESPNVEELASESIKQPTLVERLVRRNGGGKKGIKIYDENSLMGIVETGSKKKITAYESLKNAGCISLEIIP